MSRYLIIGCSGSGKSTLAERIAGLCQIPYINTDALYWRDDWTPVSGEEVLAAIDLDAESYVLDGNFVGVRERVWPKVDTIIWLNYKFHIVFSRLFVRNMTWWISGYSPWTGTRMKLRNVLSGFRHCFKSYRRKRNTYPGFLAGYVDKDVHIVNSPDEIERLLGQLCSAKTIG